MNFADINSKLAGSWRTTLDALGVKLPSGRSHGPCPHCGGKDRFRFDDKNRGRWFCNGCGSGDGWDLLKLTFGWTDADALRELNAYLGGNLPQPVIQNPSPAEPEMTDEEKLAVLHQHMRLIRENHKTGTCFYLRSKGYGDHSVIQLTRTLEFPLPDDKKLIFTRGATILRLYDWTGEVVAIQGIYRTRAGEIYKRLLAGSSKSAQYGTHRVVGAFDPTLPFVVSEGYATAFALGVMFPEVNSLMALDAGNLRNVAARIRERYPDARIAIAADNDANGAGQRGALKARDMLGDIEISWPEASGEDWDDVYRDKGLIAARKEFVEQRAKSAGLTLEDFKR
ncbi:primase-helicase zinc-binding domain-containing protein [Citrobacter portucalensis]|uniref:primase-helicase zinc-binding domain-containing protein n=1 Tax=Citrobacter portucalensis TaxID=1639133 RepID=UPI00351D9457